MLALDERLAIVSLTHGTCKECSEAAVRLAKRKAPDLDPSLATLLIERVVASAQGSERLSTHPTGDP